MTDQNHTSEVETVDMSTLPQELLDVFDRFADPNLLHTRENPLPTAPYHMVITA